MAKKTILKVKLHTHCWTEKWNWAQKFFTTTYLGTSSINSQSFNKTSLLPLMFYRPLNRGNTFYPDEKKKWPEQFFCPFFLWISVISKVNICWVFYKIISKIVRELPESVFKTGKLKNALEISYGRKTVHMRISRMRKSVQQRIRPSQTPKSNTQQRGKCFNWIEMDPMFNTYKSNLIETICLQSKWLHEAIYGSVIAEETRKNGTRCRLLRKQKAQRFGKWSAPRRWTERFRFQSTQRRLQQW